MMLPVYMRLSLFISEILSMCRIFASLRGAVEPVQYLGCLSLPSGSLLDLVLNFLIQYYKVSDSRFIVYGSRSSPIKSNSRRAS
jgi:hypothetical protein